LSIVAESFLNALVRKNPSRVLAVGAAGETSA